MATRGIASEVPVEVKSPAQWSANPVGRSGGVEAWMKSDNEELERCNDEPVEEQVPGLVCDMTRGCRYANGSGGQQGDNASSLPARSWHGAAQRRIGAGNDDGWSLLVFEKENGFRGWM
ncbi:hypothetical protein B0H65DRAFT_425488 [Neurospora tetraspora]|uniref:Uncharacterized protein n=1 Tax=Neurospora tetraspora TaxID=94610 RepID=A0AAE0JEF3_9PEZI|nr:hypothetical protein B0H65DRAFT_425488 [Neurospora tetraspora]